MICAQCRFQPQQLQCAVATMPSWVGVYCSFPDVDYCRQHRKATLFCRAGDTMTAGRLHYTTGRALEVRLLAADENRRCTSVTTMQPGRRHFQSARCATYTSTNFIFGARVRAGSPPSAVVKDRPFLRQPGLAAVRRLPSSIRLRDAIITASWGKFPRRARSYYSPKAIRLGRPPHLPLLLRPSASAQRSSPDGFFTATDKSTTMDAPAAPRVSIMLLAPHIAEPARQEVDAPEAGQSAALALPAVSNGQLKSVMSSLLEQIHTIYIQHQSFVAMFFIVVFYSTPPDAGDGLLKKPMKLSRLPYRRTLSPPRHVIAADAPAS